MPEATLQGFTREFLHSLFDYDPETGVVRWKVKPCRRICAGDIVNGPTRAGYLRARFAGQYLYVHRLVWFLMTGTIPPTVDHRNGSPADNRWSNLRAATMTQNMRNRRAPANNTTGFKGVVRHRGGRYRAQIGHSANCFHLGLFANVEQAALAYNNAAWAQFGDFASLNDIPGLGFATVPNDCIDLFA